MAAMTHEEIDRIEAALESADPKAPLEAIKLCSLASINHGTREAAWCCAMAMAYGPTGLHRDYCDAEGHPTQEARARFPEVDRKMNEARRRLTEVLIPRARREAGERRVAG